jgi:hypothetical protein
VRDARLAAGVLAASLAYAILRYNVFGTVSWEQLPLFVGNKAIAVTSLVLLGMSRLVVDRPRRKALGLTGLSLAIVHVLLSFVVLDPAYLGSHYLDTGRLRWGAEVSILTGALATALLLWLGYTTAIKPVERQSGALGLLPGIARMMLVLVAVHTAALGYVVWFDTSTWPGTMPPITMLSSLLAIAFCVLPRRPSP